MIVLVWDTSTQVGTVGLYEFFESKKSDQPQVFPVLNTLSELTLNVSTLHSEQLLWGIDQVLVSAKLELSQVDVLGVGVGPGSFTGLRIGVTTARSIGMAVGIPVVPVSSLWGLGVSTASVLCNLGMRDDLVIAAKDAAKGQLFSLVAKAGDYLDPSQFESMYKKEKAQDPRDLQCEITSEIGESGSERRWVSVGEGRLRYPEMWSELSCSSNEIAEILENPNFIRPYWIAAFSAREFINSKARSWESIVPHYLRASSAELKLNQRPVGE